MPGSLWTMSIKSKHTESAVRTVNWTVSNGALSKSCLSLPLTLAYSPQHKSSVEKRSLITQSCVTWHSGYVLDMFLKLYRPDFHKDKWNLNKFRTGFKITYWTSLAVQWLRLHASDAGAQVQSPVGAAPHAMKFVMPCSMAKQINKAYYE